MCVNEWVGVGGGSAITVRECACMHACVHMHDHV